MIAALYVESGGAYFNMAGVDPWDEARDARAYAGPYPVVAHPPCQRWGKMWFGQPLTVKLTGVRKIKGDDGGCFAAALAAVREFGGVLEHPWGSHAWAHFGLNLPARSGGWISADFHGGWTCCVEQGKYGHYARKPTLLYVAGVEELPELLWGHSEAQYDPAVVERMGLKRAKRLGEVGARGGGQNSTPRIHTPPPISRIIARHCAICIYGGSHPMNLTELKAAAETAKTSPAELELWQMEISPDDVLRLVEVARLARDLRLIETTHMPASSSLYWSKVRLDEALKDIEP